MSFNSITVAELTFNILSDMPLNNKCKLLICVIFQCEFRKLSRTNLYTKLSRSGFGLCDGSSLGACLLVGWWGPGALAVCRAHRGLPVGFLLLWYSVLFTVLSPYLCFISLLYLNLYVLGDDALIS